MNDQDYCIIPNPIYDVVFKYLMEDLESAKIILSTLLNIKIKRLNFEPISHSEKIEDPKSQKIVRIFHLDFNAIIEKSNGGEELIMIEIQKVNRPSDIFRFKKYICENFQRKVEKEEVNSRTKALELVDKPIRLIPIFILNFRIENEINDLIIRSNRTKIGLFKDKLLKSENDFIDNLSFDILVIQLPNLKKIDVSDYEGDEYKTRVYKLLRIFDQARQLANNRHQLMCLKKETPEFLDRIIKRLRSALHSGSDIESQMEVEDNYLNEIIKKNNEIDFFENKYNEASKELEEANKELEEASKGFENEKRLRQENEEKHRTEMLSVAKTLLEIGKDVDEIISLTNLSREEINNL
ncbi:MAG: hypothetical protein N4A49_11690 [Marinifilaceae bacterium]|jgi:hypothetical protein|nr:hypothetical protein [Marinifilaceae bacterium]